MNASLNCLVFSDLERSQWGNNLCVGQLVSVVGCYCSHLFDKLLVFGGVIQLFQIHIKYIAKSELAFVLSSENCVQYKCSFARNVMLKFSCLKYFPSGFLLVYFIWVNSRTQTTKGIFFHVINSMKFYIN